MEKTRWNKKYLAGFLAALAVAVPAAGITFGSAVMESFAVQQVDTGRSCSLTLGVGAESVYARSWRQSPGTHMCTASPPWM